MSDRRLVTTAHIDIVRWLWCDVIPSFTTVDGHVAANAWRMFCDNPVTGNRHVRAMKTLSRAAWANYIKMN